MTVCRTCGSPIRWERTLAGKILALNREPSPHGNVVLVHLHDTPDFDIRAQVLPNRANLLLDPGTPRYLSHLTTCTKAP